MRKILLVLLLITAQTGFAQDKFFYLTLDVNKPLSNTAWISDGSARGARLGYRAFITPRISAGLDIGWTAFDQYHSVRTIENPTGAFTTDYFNHVYSYSLAVSGQYNFRVGDEETFFPYAGIGLGANTNEYVMYYNIYDDRERLWGFLARPEAGIIIKFGARKSVGAMAAVHFDYSTNKSPRFDYEDFNTVGFQVGLVFVDF
jgi:hypothetical protein